MDHGDRAGGVGVAGDCRVGHEDPAQLDVVVAPKYLADGLEEGGVPDEDEEAEDLFQSHPGEVASLVLLDSVDEEGEEGDRDVDHRVECGQLGPADTGSYAAGVAEGEREGDREEGEAGPLDLDHRGELAALAKGGEDLHEEELLAVGAHLLHEEGAEAEGGDGEGNEEVATEVVARFADALGEEFRLLASDYDALVEREGARRHGYGARAASGAGGRGCSEIAARAR